MPRVLVTGYGGFLGRTIVRQLREAGYAVRGLARGDYPDLKSLDIEVRRASVTDRAAVLEACENCDAIVHTAALAGVWGPWRDYYTINARGTSHVIEGAVTRGARAMIYTSSPSVTFDARPQSGIDETAPYPDRWLCFYPQTKALGEQVVLQAGTLGCAAGSTKLLTCALRPHLIWGVGDPHLFPRVIARAKQGKLRRVGDGHNLIDVVHVENAARAHLLAVERLLAGDTRLNGHSLFITDGEPVECWSWIKSILETVQIPLPRKSISYAAAYRLGGMLEAAFRTFRVHNEPPMTRFVAAQLALDHYFSVQRARDLLGYNPNVDRTAELARFICF